MEIDRYYFCPAYDSWISSAFVGRKRGELYIGELLQLWKAGSWTNECPQCGGIVYLTNAGGSPLSGSGGGWGVCGNCKENIYEILPFGKFFGQIMKLPFREMPKGINFISFENLLNELENER